VYLCVYLYVLNVTYKIRRNFRGALQRVPATAAATELQQHPNFRSALQRVPATAAATELQQSCNSMQQSCNSIQILEARFKGFLTRNAKQKF
jgi:hypothetical protein